MKPRLWQAFTQGARRAVRAELRARDQHIPLEIVGRSRDEGKVHLWFRLPTDPPIQRKDIIALRASATRDLWAVFEVDRVEPDRCRGRVMKIFNEPFWARQLREAETDQSPPRGVAAQLYTDDDLRSEVETLWQEAQPSLESENG